VGELRDAIGGVFYKALSSPLEKTCRLIVALLAAPLLGATAFGTFQFAGALTGMLAGFTELGIAVSTTRALSREPTTRGSVAVLGLRLRAASALPYALLVGLSLLTLTDTSVRRVLVVIGAATFANTVVDYLGAVARGYEDFRGEATLNGARAIATATGALAGLYATRSVMGLAVGTALGVGACAIVGVLLLRPRFVRDESHGAVTAGAAIAALREALPLGISGLLATLYFRSDVVIVRFFSGDAEVGAYSAAYRIFEATMVVPATIMAVAFPRLVRSQPGGRGLARLEGQLTLLLLACGAFVGGAVAVADHRIVHALLGDTFARSTAPLRVLAWGIPITFASYATSTFVIARGLERRFVGVLALMLILNVGMNLVLVPRLGGTGAAWATLVTEGALIVGFVLLIALRGTRSARGDAP